MIQTAVAAFVGCFAAMIVLAELGGIPNKVMRYVGALLIGALLAIVLGWLLQFVVGTLSKGVG